MRDLRLTVDGVFGVAIHDQRPHRVGVRLKGSKDSLREAISDTMLEDLSELTYSSALPPF